MAPATFDALPARDAPGEARAKALRQWADETLPRELRKHAFAPRGPWERGPAERRNLEGGPPERPGGWGKRGR
jgi:hypothetical protein